MAERKKVNVPALSLQRTQRQGQGTLVEDRPESSNTSHLLFVGLAAL